MYLKDVQIQINLKAYFIAKNFFSILKLLLLVKESDESILFCRDMKTEAQIENYRKASF